MAIKGVIHEARGIEHEDSRRTLLTAFNGDLDNFTAKQAKFAEMHKDAPLGGHYHKYRELFYMLRGEAVFDLIDISTKEREQFIVKRGDRLLIPAGIAHKVSVAKDSTLVGFTEEAYISRENNDYTYEFPNC